MDDDEREVELSTISAIFPEIVLDSDNRFTASIELPVKPSNPLTVSFPASFEGPPPANTTTLPHPAIDVPDDINRDEGPVEDIERHDLRFLPSLQLNISLPEGYPAENPPRFDLSTTPAWLSRDILDSLQADGQRMWEEFGRDQVVFAYIDHLQQAAENGFGLMEESQVVEIAQEHQISLLDHNIKGTKAAFDKETFDCGICLDPKKGSVCHKMVDCEHVFCVQCLQDFYNNAITEGDITSVRCLAPNCAKERAAAQAAASKKSRKPKTQLSPSELIQIRIGHEMVTRYVNLKHKADLESDKNTIYCPRKWCQGAAKSKKHRKPEGFEIVESDNDESDTEDKIIKNRVELLSICEDCSFAFCSRCYQGWHGELVLCFPLKRGGVLTEEDQASMDYLKLHTTPCPTCAAPCQKTHGCNHMVCFRCNTHFCYLCSAWLDPGNPYRHYNTETTGCFQRLWELEAGDGDDVGIGYAGGARDHLQEQEPVMEIEEPFEIEEPDDEEFFQLPAHDEDRPPVQREGPLVFRINVPPPPPPAAPMAPALVEPHNGRGRGRGRRAGQQARAAARNRNDQGVVPPAQAANQDDMQRAWVQRFVELAMNDEEDLLDWDSDEEDHGAWEIPVR
ncbi:RWD domain-containing protein [Phlyctema vagabunda]|uniref:RBR-type E3 ubiquitin transferase n=1 Tax=Phlyctema vagabunda TaxID=108571 RepID=A0ABR4PHA8_9HELO